MSKKSTGCGCFTILGIVFVVWIVLFGITVGGRHHGLKSCNTHSGVSFE